REKGDPKWSVSDRVVRDTFKKFGSGRAEFPELPLSPRDRRARQIVGGSCNAPTTIIRAWTWPPAKPNRSRWTRVPASPKRSDPRIPALLQGRFPLPSLPLILLGHIRTTRGPIRPARSSRLLAHWSVSGSRILS